MSAGALRPWLADPIVASLLFVVAASVFFWTFPGVDMWFTRLFYDPAIGFPVSRLGAFIGLRAIGDALPWIVLAVIVLALVVKLARPSHPTPIAPQKIFFLASTLAIGPGIVVNLILKNHWGRPRPFMVDAFGGHAPYVPVWQISNICGTNCSFVSGEASSAIWLMALALVVPVRWRQPVAIAAAIVAVVASLNRIAFGGHFLSDVVLAWGLTLVVIAVFHRLYISHPPPGFSQAAIEANLTRAGEGLRRLWPKRG